MEVASANCGGCGAQITMRPQTPPNGLIQCPSCGKRIPVAVSARTSSPINSATPPGANPPAPVIAAAPAADDSFVAADEFADELTAWETLRSKPWFPAALGVSIGLVLALMVWFIYALMTRRH